ncbi:hypothetical protein B566_EDAN014295 [Ephemera danica]|nr:hypothetical protein B566_EDAN014295 [Ephemera danica]
MIGSRTDMFHSNQSLHTRGGIPGSAIAEQTIPEVDEQTTVISMRGKEPPRPHMQDIFAVAVPTTPSPTIEVSPPHFNPSLPKSSPLSVPAGPPRPRRQPSSDSSGSDEDERTRLRPSDMQDSGLSGATDTESLLLQPTNTTSPPRLVRQAGNVLEPPV